MTPEIQSFIYNLRLKGRALEVGSYDVNGSVRGFFDEYVGVDRRAGPNVDAVMSGHELHFDSQQFDHVLCLETLEHDEAFWLTIPELKRVLKPGGRLVITVPGFGFPKHDFPVDYWRMSPDAVSQLLSDMESIEVKQIGQTVMAHAVKPWA